MARSFLAVPVIALCLSGCRFDGIESVALPGGVGQGEDAITITVALPDVGTLTPNSQVKVGDVAVGTVTRLDVVDWHAEATLSLQGDVQVPANAVARVGINSLLGSNYIELAPPEDAPAHGTLVTGAAIPLDRGEAYPATEQVLSSASVVLNGGGLEQLSTITTELNKALGGNHLAVRDLLPQLDSFIGALDAQKGDILRAIDDMDRLSQRFARNRGTLTAALDQIGPALEVLSRERPKLTKALVALKKLDDVATPLVLQTKADLLANLRDIAPALRALSKAGDSMVNSLGFAVTFPFAPETVGNACRSDYCNLFLTLDLTAEALADGFVDANGNPGIPGLPGIPDLPLPQVSGLDSLANTPIIGPTLDSLVKAINALQRQALVDRQATIANQQGRP